MGGAISKYGKKNRAPKPTPKKSNTDKFIEMFYMLRKNLRRDMENAELDELRQFVAMQSFVSHPEEFDGIKDIYRLVGTVDVEAVDKAFKTLNHNEIVELFNSDLNGPKLKEFVASYECYLSPEAIIEKEQAKGKASTEFYAKKARSLYVRQQKLLGGMLVNSDKYVNKDDKFEVQSQEYKDKIDLCIARMLAAKNISDELLSKGSILGVDQMKLMGSKGYIEDRAIKILESEAFKSMEPIHNPQMIPITFSVLAIGAERVFNPDAAITDKASEKSETAISELAKAMVELEKLIEEEKE